MVEILKKKEVCEVCGPDAECTCVKVSLEDLYALGALMIELISKDEPFVEMVVRDRGWVDLIVDGRLWGLVEAEIQVLKRMKVPICEH